MDCRPAKQLVEQGLLLLKSAEVQPGTGVL